jgi:hypothetical protein
MPETPFIITIDTEGDNLWARPKEITTRNADCLPRFQSLCERFGFKPVYLTNHEMAMSDAFVEFGRDMLARGAGEIGMHLHAWNSPPLVPLTRDDFHYQPYLIEYPEAVMKEKIDTLTRTLEDRFGEPVASHRAGRWAFDRRYAALLIDAGYRVDCSVTPGVDWRAHLGTPDGRGGSDYRACPDRAYFLDPANAGAPAADRLLEVPMTIRSSALHQNAPWAYRIPLLRRAANRLSPSQSWLCPVQPALNAPPGRALEVMLQAARDARAANVAHMEFMLHSSELMAGGNPTFITASDIERLYEYLHRLFEELSDWCRGTTLKEFHRLAVSGAPE